MNTGRRMELSGMIKERAKELGFDLCGIARARKLEERRPVLTGWLTDGMNGDMAFLERDKEKRLDPTILFPGSRSVIVTGINYYNEKKQRDDVPVLSRYSYGKDYHVVILEKLNKILELVTYIEPSSTGKAFVDSAPVMEKAWAAEAGLGWQGRNSLVINSRIGSFFFIGILLLDIELEYDKTSSADCGECRLCISLCPTGAINDNRTIDARKCIAYHTIENKGNIPADLSKRFRGRVFGCDICQEVCPWNKNARINTTAEFSISPILENLSADNWKSMDTEQFKRLFENTPAGRIKYQRMMRNIEIAITSLPWLFPGEKES